MTRDELIAALEKATEGDTFLDADIHEAAGRGYVIENTSGEAWFVKDKPSAVRQTQYEVPRYTTSLDAALSLVPKDPRGGWFWRVGYGSQCGGWAHLNRVHPDHCEQKDEASAEGATPTLALCIAALKASAP